MFGGGFGGFRGGFPGFPSDDDSSSQPQGEMDNKSLYELLDLKPGSTTDEVKKAFRKKAIREHPDKGGDAEKFKKLTEAYEILSNPEKKDVYDRYGMEGLKNGGGAGDMGDIFSQFFGGGGGRKDNGPKKMKAKMRELQVTLEDVYEGKMIHLPHKRKRCCETCEGKGGQNARTCPQCKGKRVIEKLIQLGPGMYSQQRGACGECQGEGTVYAEKDRCKTCKGQRLVDVEKVIEIPLEKGVPDEHDYQFYGESDEMPGVMAGDLYIRIKIAKHKVFERKGADLYMNKAITLVEALTGCAFQVKFLDGSTLNISTKPGEIISPGQIKTIKKKGMPFYKDSMSDGDLNIRFEIEFPKSLPKEAVEKIQQVLPQPKHQVKFSANDKVHTLVDFDANAANLNAEGGNQKEEDEDDGHHGQGQRVQCAQQ